MKPETMAALPPADRKRIVEPGVNGLSDKVSGNAAGKITLMSMINSEEVGKYVSVLIMPFLLVVSLLLIVQMFSDIRTDLKELNVRTEQAGSRAAINASRLDYIQAEINEIKADLKELQKK